MVVALVAAVPPNQPADANPLAVLLVVQLSQAVPHHVVVVLLDAMVVVLLNQAAQHLAVVALLVATADVNQAVAVNQPAVVVAFWADA